MECMDLSGSDICRNPMPTYHSGNRHAAGAVSAVIGVCKRGMALVYGYYLISIGIERKRDLFIIERIAHYLEETGKVSLYCLLLSNLFIFALAGSSFSFRSEGYAYTFFIVILLLMGYLKYK